MVSAGELQADVSETVDEVCDRGGYSRPRGTGDSLSTLSMVEALSARGTMPPNTPIESTRARATDERLRTDAE